MKLDPQNYLEINMKLKNWRGDMKLDLKTI